MFKTRITEMLGIEYPILQGGMMWVSCPELAAAVSNAGGLGILTSAGCRAKENLREDIKKTKSLTDKPFGVNISLFPTLGELPNDDYIDVILEENVAVVESSGVRAPDEYVPRLREAGVKTIHKCAASRHAQKAEQAGVDAVTVVGTENGGATGMLNVGSMVLVPVTVSLVSIPVIAGGGIADARGFVAALALGAEGVVVGTRFMATKEAPLHQNFKDWLLRSKEHETTIVMRSIRNAHRVILSPITEKLLEMEARNAPIEELATIIGGSHSEEVLKEGKLDAGMGMAGQAVGLINDVVTVKHVIDGMVNGAKDILGRLDKVVA